MNLNVASRSNAPTGAGERRIWPQNRGERISCVDQWVWPAYIGVIGGILLFFALFTPAVLVQMRRYGRISPARMLGTAALVVYGVALIAYTLLPLPSGDLAQWCGANGVPGAQLDPLQFIADIRTDTAGLGVKATLTHTTTLQVVFNVVLFVPLGFLARKFLGFGVVVSTLGGLATSLLIELTQYTGIYGLVPCSYRVADVDDVLANTAGGLIGALIAPILLSWMPQARELARSRMAPRPVTVWRRWLGMLIDAFFATFLGGMLVITWRMIRAVAGQTVDPHVWSVSEWLLQYPVPLLVVFTVPACVGSGASLGQRAVWLHPVGPDGAPVGLARRLARAWVAGGLWLTLLALAGLPDVIGQSADWFDRGAVIVAVIAVLSAVPSSHRGLSAALTGLHLVDSRAAHGDATSDGECAAPPAEDGSEHRR